MAAVTAYPLVRRRMIPWVPSGPPAVVAGVIIVVLLVVAAIAPLAAPHDPNFGDLSNALAGTSGEHLLGTDAAGRDILSRLIYGARTSLLGPFVVVVLSGFIGIPLGLLAGYRRGFIDAGLSRLWDLLFGFPPLLLAIIIVAAFGPGFWTAVIAVSVIYVPIVGRVVRGVVLIEREKPYVAACRIHGFSGSRIATLHMLPNVAGVVAAQMTLNFGTALLDLAALAFLGLGVQPPAADWGQMLTTGRDTLPLGAWLEVASASVAIVVAVIAVNVFGDAIAQRSRESA